VPQRSRIIIPAAAAKGHLGFYRKGGLPHLDVPNLIQLVTFRLRDSLPRCLGPDDGGQGIDDSLDRGLGGCILKHGCFAEIVADALRPGHHHTHSLIAWVVMPNHVHVLADTGGQSTIGDLVGRWKGSSARRINAAGGRSGALWQPGYYDRYIRDAEHLEAAVAYVENNPVKASLCVRPGDWRYSSASVPADDGPARSTVAGSTERIG